MEKKEYKSPHGWFIILLIVFTLCIFLWTMVYTMGQENVIVIRKYKKEVSSNGNGDGNGNMMMMDDDSDQCSSNLLKLDILGKKPLMTTTLATTTSTSNVPNASVKIIRGEKPLTRHDKTDLINEAMKRYVRSLPNTMIDIVEGNAQTSAYSVESVSLDLHGYEIAKFSVGKSFYIYDCNITPTPDKLVITILMELPEINVEFKDFPVYSMYCPTINPYIHAVELKYVWAYDKETFVLEDFMKLSSLKITMVSWDDNLYRKSYEQVKNSPLYKVDVPVPLNLKKEELYNFLTKSSIFSTIPMIFNPPISLQQIQGSSSSTPI